MKAALLATAAAIAGTAVADGAHMHRHAHEALHQRRALQAGGEASAADAQGGEHTCGCSTTEVITYYAEPTCMFTLPFKGISRCDANHSVIPLPGTTSTPTSTPTPTPEAVTTLSSTSTSTLTVVVTSQPPAPPAPAPEETSSATPEAPATTEQQTSAAETPAPVETPSPAETSTPAESVAPVETSSSTPAPAPAPATSSTPAPELPTHPVTSFSSTGVYTVPAKTLTVTDATTVCDATGTEVPSGTHTVGGVTTSVTAATTVTCPYATVKPSGSTSTSVIETTTYVCPSAGSYTIAPIVTSVPTSTMLVYPTPATFTPGTYTKPEQTITATNTDYHYVCPESSSSSPAPATTSATPSSSETPLISVSVSLPILSSTPSATPSNSPSNVLGMTYSPYANDGNCKGEAEVLKDVSHIAEKGFSHVRLYATDCNGLENVGKAARQHNLKMIVGVYIDDTGASGAQKQVKSLSEWGQWDMVTLVVIGNEAVQDGKIEIGELAGLITSAKKTFQESGYNGDVTTTEPINVWEQKGKSLCSAIDSVGANIHPFFNSQVSPEKAGKFAHDSVGILEKICPGKDVLILETGWPNNGDANGAAVPGKEQQAAAIKALVDEVGKQSVFFSFSDDKWKSAGNFNVERFWGCIENF